MKKFILSLAIIALLSCLFVISAGAVEINKDTKVEIHGGYTDTDGNPVSTVGLYDEEGYALVWYLNTDGYLVSARVGDEVNVDQNGKISFKDVTKFKNKNQYYSVVCVNLRDGVKTSDGTNYDGKIKTFDLTFQFGNYNVKNTVMEYFYFPITTTALVDRMFQCTPIYVADILPGTPISTFGVHSFYKAKNLEEIFIPNEVTSFFFERSAGMFTECSSLKRVVFEEGSQMKNIGSYTFYSCSSLEELYLPNSVETAGNRFVQYCSKLKALSFGASFKGFTNAFYEDMWFMYGCSKLTEIYMPMLDMSTYSSANWSRIFSNTPDFTLYFTGTEEELSALAKKFQEAGNNEKITTIVGTDRVKYVTICEAFYNNVHSFDEAFVNPCASTCAVCSSVVLSENPQHNIDTSIEYSGGFNTAGVKTTACTNKGCTYCIEQSVNALVICLGSSVSEFDVGSLTIGFKADADAISEYKNITGCELDFGVFAVSQNKLGSNEIFGENGASAGVLSFSLTNSLYSVFQIKLTGFKTDEQKATELVLGAYISQLKDGTLTYSYIQEKAPSEEAKYYISSYNDMAAIK